MKKALPWILGMAAVVLLLLLVKFSGGSAPRRLDERITLRSRDRIPYGTSAVYNLLPSLFSPGKVVRENAAPLAWDSVSFDRPNQGVVLLSDYFDASTEDLNRLASFAERGNYVFIVARAASEDVETYFDVSFRNVPVFTGEVDDSLHVQLAPPVFTNTSDFTYPGKTYAGSLTQKATTPRFVTLGKDNAGLTNFIRLDKGRGSIFLHSAPLAFSNYFVLHKRNAGYIERVLSVLPAALETVVWNEFYLEDQRAEREPNWLSALLSYPSFRNGLLLATAAVLLSLLLGMRRRQRQIAPYAKPANDSLDFVRTLGRLYYDRRDHQNLAAKMATYFLEHVRTRYALPTHTLDENFVQALQAKSGYPLDDIKQLVETVLYVQSVSFLPETELATFYQRLEAFYQTT